MALRIAVAAVVIAVAAALGYYFLRPYLELPPPPPPPVLHGKETPKTPQFPIGTDAKPLPKLGESDRTLHESIASVVDPQSLAKFFDLEDGIRRVVATVDNLSRESIARRLNPVRPIDGAFLVTGKGESVAIDAKNGARYTPFVRMAEAIDAP